MGREIKPGHYEITGKDLWDSADAAKSADHAVDVLVRLGVLEGSPSRTEKVAAAATSMADGTVALRTKTANGWVETNLVV